jgi:glyoxylase I family protein
MFKKIDHVEIIPRDADITIDFYTNILNFKVKERKTIDKPPMKAVIFLELSGTTIELVSVQNPSPRSSDPWQIGYATPSFNNAE